MPEVWILQGRKFGSDRQVICERQTQEGCIMERERRLQPTIHTRKGKQVVIESEWCWTAITRKNARLAR